MMSDKFYHDRPPVTMATKFFRQNGYNSACIRAISEIFASNREWVIQATCMTYRGSLHEYERIMREE